MIQIKAKQQNVSFEKNVEKLAYVLSARRVVFTPSKEVKDELQAARENKKRAYHSDTPFFFVLILNIVCYALLSTAACSMARPRR